MLLFVYDLFSIFFSSFLCWSMSLCVGRTHSANGVQLCRMAFFVALGTSESELTWPYTIKFIAAWTTNNKIGNKCPTIKVIPPSISLSRRIIRICILTVGRRSVGRASIATWSRSTSSRWSVAGARTKGVVLPSTNCARVGRHVRWRPLRPSKINRF